MRLLWLCFHFIINEGLWFGSLVVVMPLLLTALERPGFYCLLSVRSEQKTRQKNLFMRHKNWSKTGHLVGTNVRARSESDGRSVVRYCCRNDLVCHIISPFTNMVAHKGKDWYAMTSYLNPSACGRNKGMISVDTTSASSSTTRLAKVSRATLKDNLIHGRCGMNSYQKITWKQFKRN